MRVGTRPFHCVCSGRASGEIPTAPSWVSLISKQHAVVLDVAPSRILQYACVRTVVPSDAPVRSSQR
eukprot:6531148-Pyramimonas_sp.AAC.1